MEANARFGVNVRGQIFTWYDDEGMELVREEMANALIPRAEILSPGSRDDE